MMSSNQAVEDTQGSRVLSIQSHVVSGYVGNKAAVFPLQLLGFEVDVINSVHFSNHTGYAGGVEGDVLDGAQLRTILGGLERNGLLPNVGHIMTGYIGSESFLEAVLEVVERVRSQSQTPVRYVCDPVLGDHGRFYVPPELVDVYRRRVIPLANVLTPNQFEVEQLTGIMVSNLEDAKRACRVLHDMGPALVIITSLMIPVDRSEQQQGSATGGGDGDDGRRHKSAKSSICILASQRLPAQPSAAMETESAMAASTTSSSATTTRLWRITCPVIAGQYTGTGDLCAALLLAHTANQDGNIPGALEQVVNTMYAVIERTHSFSTSMGGNTQTSPQHRELRLIQSKQDIEAPPQRFRATQIQ